MKRRTKIGLSASFAVLVWASAFAADDESLMRILTRADIADNFAFYCAQYDPSIIDRTRSTVGDMQALMFHIRNEVVSGLPESEARRIVVQSAGAARTGALMAIRKHYGPNPVEERARLHEWCEKSVVPSLKEYVARHDEHHVVLDQEIRRAKQVQ